MRLSVAMAVSCLVFASLSAMERAAAAPARADDQDSAGGAAAGAGGADASSGSASGLDEIIVTAQKRSENMQDVPIAISVLTGDELQKKGVHSFADFAKSSPSLSFQPNTGDGTAPRIFMRGQGTTNYPQTVNSEGSVGIYQDGFYIARPQAISTLFDLADIERTEILRGPQGTLYGRNTTGGAINVISKAPSGSFGLKQVLDFGNRNEFRSLSSIDLPAWRDLAVKLTVLKTGIDGTTKNFDGSSNDYGLRRSTGGRAQLRWSNQSGFTADYFAEVADMDSTPPHVENVSNNGATIVVNGAPYVYSGAGTRQDVTTVPTALRLSTTKFWGNGLTLGWEISDALTIKSLTGYFNLDQHGYFADWSLANAKQDNTASAISSHQFSQELQFLGSFLDRQITYVAGLYYFRESGHARSDQIPALTYLTPKSESISKAAFGQVTWAPEYFSRKLELTGGVRYTKDNRDTHGVGIYNPSFVIYDDSANAQYHRFNPAFTANYHLTNDVGVYAKVAEGYRAGGSFFGGFATNNSYQPEDITSYEAGLKSLWFDRSLRVNLAVFHSKLDQMQQAVVLDASNRTHVFNVGKATIEGAELEAVYSPVTDVTLSLNYAYLDTKIDEFPVIAGSIYDHAANPASPYAVGQNIAGIFTMPNAPEHSVGAAFDYTFLHVGESRASAHVDYRYQGKVYDLIAGPGIPGNDLRSQPSYSLVNARLTWQQPLQSGSEVAVSLWTNNAFDKKYLTSYGPGRNSATLSGLNVPLGAAAAGFAPTNYVQFGEPRTFGITVQYVY